MSYLVKLVDPSECIVALTINVVGLKHSFCQRPVSMVINAGLFLPFSTVAGIFGFSWKLIRPHLLIQLIKQKTTQNTIAC